MKRFAFGSLLIVAACSSIWAQPHPTSGPGGPSTTGEKEPSKVEMITREMKGAYEMLSNELGLTPEEKKKVEALTKKMEADIAVSGEKMTKDDFEAKIIMGFRETLNEEHAKKFDEFTARAKKMSERSYNAASARGICIGLNVYSSESDGKLPATLGELVTKGLCAPKQFVMKGGPTKLPADLGSKDPKEQAKWVNENSDYIYTGAGLNATKLVPDFVVIYDKGGTLFGCADGHVAMSKEDEAAKALEELKAGKNPPPSLKGK